MYLVYRGDSFMSLMSGNYLCGFFHRLAFGCEVELHSRLRFQRDSRVFCSITLVRGLNRRFGVGTFFQFRFLYVVDSFMDLNS